MLYLSPSLQAPSGHGDGVMVLIPVMDHSRVSLAATVMSTVDCRVKMPAHRKQYNDWPWGRDSQCRRKQCPGSREVKISKHVTLNSLPPPRP